jgi:hypothetical protein
MTRRVVWSVLLAVAFAVLVITWFLAKFEQVPIERWTPPAKEARRNPYLALERFMSTMGRPLARAENAAFLDKLPAGGVLILDSHRRAHLSPARVTALLDWVESGGYLIVAPEPSGVDDPILEFFDVTCSCKDEQPRPAPKARKALPPKSVAIAIPGTEHPLQAQFIYSRMKPGEYDPEWQAAAPNYPAQILHFDHGDGHVTMIEGLSQLFDNRHIGQLDHAELLWTLLETYQPDRSRPVTLMARLVTPSLWEWLAESAWTAVIAAAALVALWLWASVPRFGEARPEPEAARRELGEHLAAIGRYVWRAGGLEHWLEVARESFRSRLALRHPAILALPPAEQAVALAEITQRPISLIATALHQPAGSPQSFTQALRTLRKLESIL